MKTKLQILKVTVCLASLVAAVFAAGCSYEPPSRAQQKSQPLAASLGK